MTCGTCVNLFPVQRKSTVQLYSFVQCTVLYSLRYYTMCTFCTDCTDETGVQDLSNPYSLEHRCNKSSYGVFEIYFRASRGLCSNFVLVQLKLSLSTKMKPLILGAKITIFPWNFRHRPLCNETLSFGSRFRIWNLRKIQLLLKKWEQKQNTP